MKAIVGSKKQEKKISEMGAVANKMFPKIETMVFKGSFRLGISAALDLCNLKTWDDVSLQSAHLRKKFFDNFLKESIPYLRKTGVSEDGINDLISKLMKENKKYLTN